MAKKRNRGKKKSGNPPAKPDLDQNPGGEPDCQPASPSATKSLDSGSTYSNYEFGICLAFLIGSCLYLIRFLFEETEIGTRFDAYLALVFNASIYWAYWTGSPEGSLHLFDRWPIFVGFCFHVFVATGIGSLLLGKLVTAQSVTRLERALLAIVLGLAVISTYTLIVGLLQVYSWKQLAILPLVVCAGWGWFLEREAWILGKVDSNETNSVDHRARHWTQWLWLAALPFLMLLFLGSMLPPWEFDVREYHLQVPKEWFQSGGVSFLSHNVYGNMPLGTEMHALFGMLYSFGEDDWWWGALIGKTVSGCFPILNFGLLVVLGSRLFGRFAGIVAGVIYVSTPWTIANGIIGYNEGALSCYVLASILVLISMLFSIQTDENSRSDNAESGSGPLPKFGPLLLYGMMLGGAVSSKYTAVPFVAIPALLVLMWVLDRSSIKDWIKAGGVVVLGITLISGCWFGKNLVFTGNPTYPLMSSILPSPRTASQVKQWDAAHSARGRPVGIAALSSALKPLVVSYKWLSPLLVPLLLLAFFSPQKNKLFPLLGFLMFAVAVWWLVTHRLERFLFPFYPIACLIAGAGSAWIHHLSWRNLVTGLVIGGCVFNFLFAASRIVGDIRIFASLRQLDVRSLDAADYSHPDDQIYQLSHLSPEVAWLNANEPDAKVLFFGECRAFEAEFKVIYNTCFDPCQTWLRMHNRTTSEIHQVLLDEGITHVLVNIPELDRMRNTYEYNVSDAGQPIDEQAVLNLEGVVLERVPVAIPGQASRQGVLLFRVIPVS